MRDGYLIPPRFKHCSERECARMIIGFLAKRYPASYTSEEIAYRLNFLEKTVANHLNEFLRSRLVQATRNRLDNSIAWNCSPKGRVEFSMFEPVRPSVRKFLGRLKTIYIAGPMAKLPDNNFRAFFDAEARLISGGWNTVNPARFTNVFGDKPSGKMLDACCQAELAVIPYCDAIYLLKGWENSKGAKRELAVALHHNLVVIEEVK